MNSRSYKLLITFAFLALVLFLLNRNSFKGLGDSDKPLTYSDFVRYIQDGNVSGVEILKVFDELNAQGKTLILVTHDPSVGKRARRTIRLSDGRVESDVRQ